MLIFPAIDLKDGCCVRLRKGDYATAHKVAEDPLQTALSFKEAGAEWIHMVDLDGAKNAVPKNQDIIFKVCRESGLSVEIGGGIRNMKTVASYLEGGLSRVILGSAALKAPEFVREAVKAYADKIAVGIDARGGKVATEGWLDTSSVDCVELALRMEEMGVRTLIFTDIAKDGMLSGPNLEQLQILSRAVSCNIVASGGISSLDDIKSLRELELYGAICGKALYTGALDLKQALKQAQ